MADCNSLTPQQVFDQVVSHLRTQRCRSFDANSCRYRFECSDGRVLKCAAGVLIRDDEYREWMDKGISTYFPNIMDDARCPESMKERLGPHLNLITMLQRVHDQYYNPGQWEKQLEKVSAQYGLTYLPPQE